MILDSGLPGLSPWEENKANPFLWHFGFHQTPDVPEKLITGRQFIYFREGMFNRFALHKDSITDSDVNHYVNSYGTSEKLRAGLEFYRAFPANEKFNAAKRNVLNNPIVLAGGDKAAGPTLLKMAESLRKYGCTNVTTKIIQNSGHFVSEEQPEIVIGLIEYYASK